MTQLFLRFHDVFDRGASVGCIEGVFAVDENERVGLGFSFFGSEVVEGATALLDLKSNAVPGVFGVFDAEPNDANAPDPRLKALDAFPVGDEIPDV